MDSHLGLGTGELGGLSPLNNLRGEAGVSLSPLHPPPKKILYPYKKLDLKGPKFMQI